MAMITYSILELDKDSAMNEASNQFLQQLRASVEGVLFSSAGDYPFGIFTWNLQEDGKFNTKNFLNRQEYLESMPLADAFGLGEYSKGYQRCGVRTPDGGVFYASSDLMDDFLEASRKQGASEPFSHMNEKENTATQYAENLQSFISGLTSEGYEVFAYRVAKNDLPVQVNEKQSVDHRLAAETYESFRLLTIRIKNDVWVAISSYEDWAEYYNDTEAKYICPGLHNNSSQAKTILDRFQEVAKDVVFIRRNCYDHYKESERLIFEVATSQNAAIDRVLYGNGFINTCEFDGLDVDEDICLTSRNGFRREDIPNHRVVQIDEILRSYLSDLREVYVGTHSVYDAYFIGQDFEGNWLGLCTVDVQC
ncbi:MAG: hypothetical protein F6K00_09180 [Leptolyngbya sp. SIOISBB]|nr:hypothetical protein [Leptolyngbya sp. SIOISBB]